MAFKLNHLHLKTKDPQKTAKFYVDNLGATIVAEIGTRGYRLDLHGLTINLTTMSKTRPVSSSMAWSTSRSIPMTWMAPWPSSRPMGPRYWSK